MSPAAGASSVDAPTGGPSSAGDLPESAATAGIPSLPRLLLLTDRTMLPTGRDLVDTVARCAEAGLGAVVLRELDLPEAARAGLATALAAHLPVIAARTPLPAAVGVHERSALHHACPRTSRVPTTGLRSTGLRGRSCHTPDDVRHAVTDGVDYVTISPVLPTASKPGYGPAIGVAGVRSAVSAAGRTPVLALGGVDADTVAPLRAAGAYGVAVLGAVMRSDDPAAVVRTILRRLR